MNIGETVEVPASKYVEVEIAGNNYRRHSADDWIWLIGESTETVGPNEAEDFEKAYQEAVSKQWEKEAIAQQEQIVPPPETKFSVHQLNGFNYRRYESGQWFRVNGKGFDEFISEQHAIDMENRFNKKEGNEFNYRRGYQQGYNAAMENVKGEFDIALTHMSQFRDNQLNGWRHEQRNDRTIEPPEYSYPYVGSGKSMMFAMEPIDGSDLNEPGEHVVQIVDVKEPTRPSEDDMMGGPKENLNPTAKMLWNQIQYERCADGSWFNETDHCAVGKYLEETLEKEFAQQFKHFFVPKGPTPTEGPKPSYEHHPQFRDIGIRIDRYGKLMFKPELVE